MLRTRVSFVFAALFVISFFGFNTPNGISEAQVLTLSRGIRSIALESGELLTPLLLAPAGATL